MKKEDKELLLKDISARLSYHLKLYYKGKYGTEPKPIILIDINNRIINSTYEIEGCKPYLRPLSSMTDEEREIYHSYCDFDDGDYTGNPMWFDTIESFDYLYSRHFDIRNLIPRGLALEAPKGMYDNINA